MSYARLEDRVKADEGFRAVVYQDIFGKWTIGYGSTFIHGRPVTEATPRVTRRQALISLRAGLFYSLKSVDRLYPRLDKNEEVRWEVLTNMAYNLGERGLAGFKRLKLAVDSKDWIEAALQIEDSAYFKQVGSRAIRCRDAVRTGSWSLS